MGLQDLKFNKTITGILRRKHWTVEKLATASITELTRLPGIGKKTAQDVIAKAKELINQSGLKESQQLDSSAMMPPITIDMTEYPMSVRQRRILAAYEQQQKEQAG